MHVAITLHSTQLVRAMSTFHKINATGLTPLLCATDSALICGFVCITRCPAVSLGGVPYSTYAAKCCRLLDLIFRVRPDIGNMDGPPFEHHTRVLGCWRIFWRRL